VAATVPAPAHPYKPLRNGPLQRFAGISGGLITVAEKRGNGICSFLPTTLLCKTL